MIGCFDREGRPITIERWGELHSDLNYTVIRKDWFGQGDDEIEVSTCWLGINHQWVPDLPPLIFETMIFGGPMNLECWRYATEAQAVEGHGYVVSLVRADLALTTKEGGGHDEPADDGD